MLNTVEEGLEDIRQGKVLIVVDDEDRENEGDFIVSGEKITPEIVNFMITHGRGLLCAPLPRSRCEELGLAPMAEENTSLLGTPFTMSVDLRGYGCTTGVSAFDRSSTIKSFGGRKSESFRVCSSGACVPPFTVRKMEYWNVMDIPKLHWI